MFSISRRAILCKVKKNKRLRGGVLVYAAQENVQFEAEIAQKGRFGMKTDMERPVVKAQIFITALCFSLARLGRCRRRMKVAASTTSHSDIRGLL